MVGNALCEVKTTFISDKSYWHRAWSYSVLNYACLHFSMSLKIIHALDFNPSRELEYEQKNTEKLDLPTFSTSGGGCPHHLSCTHSGSKWTEFS